MYRITERIFTAFMTRYLNINSFLEYCDADFYFFVFRITIYLKVKYIYIYFVLNYLSLKE